MQKLANQTQKLTSQRSEFSMYTVGRFFHQNSCSLGLFRIYVIFVLRGNVFLFSTTLPYHRQQKHTLIYCFQFDWLCHSQKQRKPFSQTELSPFFYPHTKEVLTPCHPFGTKFAHNKIEKFMRNIFTFHVYQNPCESHSAHYPPPHPKTTVT